MLILLEGPEKVGKSTLAKALLEQHGHGKIRKWGPIPEHWVYAEPLEEDLAKKTLVVWDRAWVSEHVYAELMNRNRILRTNTWEGAWMHDRAVDPVALKVVLTGPADISAVLNARDETDLPCDPVQERALFVRYAKRYNWRILQDNRVVPVETVAKGLLRIAERLERTRIGRPPFYCGAHSAAVVFLTDKIVYRNTARGAWLPFSDPAGVRLGQAFGDAAMNFGWAVMKEVSPANLRERVVVACGKEVQAWCNWQNITNRIDVPHASRLSITPELLKQISHQLQGVSSHG